MKLNGSRLTYNGNIKQKCMGSVLKGNITYFQTEIGHSLNDNRGKTIVM